MLFKLINGNLKLSQQLLSYLSENAVSFLLLKLYKRRHLRVNVSIIQSDAEQGSVDLADFHIYSTVFHADSHGTIRFS